MEVQMGVSYSKHGARTFYVVGHAECAGFPVADETHRAAVLEAAKVVLNVAQKLGFHDVDVIPLWNERGEDGRWVSQSTE